MEYKDRTILIVEDDVEYNESFKEYCDSALGEISEKLAIHGTVEQAYNYDQAQKILNSDRKVDFISLDLALTKGEIAASGMRLLRELRAKNSRTIAIIVSGESNIAYPIEALQKHGALAYFFKAADIEETYTHAVKAALRYLETEDRVLELEQQPEPDPVVLQVTEEQWRKVLADTAKAGIDNRQLPNDLGPRIDTLHNKLLDPNTRLPIGRLLRKNLAERVIGHHEELWSLVHIRVENFGIFQTSYPSKIKPLLSIITSVLRDVTSLYQDADPFVGFLDQHQTTGPSFLVILKEEEGNSLAQNVENGIRELFTGLSKGFLTGLEIRDLAKEMADKAMQEKQYPGLSEKDLITKFTAELRPILSPKLNIDIFSSQESYFGDINELIDELTIPGS